MLASQLIYTSWKNGSSTRKGYMVYSKSRDITDEEVEKILAVMRYEAPSFLPYTPTKEEIELSFPKNFAYFQLPSGRFCIAQSCYIGQDYTNRWGNYIIHAYVIDDIENMIPSNLIGADIFRRCLTDEELNAEKAPDFLPQVEIEDKGLAITEQEINAFFNCEQRINLLKKLVQLSINSAKNQTKIKFVDDYENMKYWIKAISLLIPRALIKYFYFSTYVVTETKEISFYCLLPNNTASSCAPVSFSSEVSVVNAQEEFECERKPYTDVMVDLFANDYFNCILRINELEKIMLEYSITDLDFATKIQAIRSGNFNFVAIDEIEGILKLIKEKESNFSTICESCLMYVSCSEEIKNNKDVLAICRLIFPYLSDDSKEDLLMMYADKYLLESNTSDKDLYFEISNDCPCEWKTAIQFFIKENFIEHIRSYKNVKVDMFLFKVLIYAYSINQDGKDELKNTIKSIYNEIIETKSKDRVTQIFNVLSNVGEADNALLKEMFYSVCENDISFFRDDVDYLFFYLRFAVTYGEYFWTVLCKVLSYYPEIQDKCIEEYVRLIESKQGLENELGKFALQHQQIKKFIESVKLFNLKREQVDGKEGLLEIIEQTYGGAEQEADSEIVKVCEFKIKQFFADLEPKHRFKQGLWIFERLFSGRDDEKYKGVLEILLDGMFNGYSLKILIQNAPKAEVVNKILSVARDFGVQVRNSGELYICGEIICQKLKLNKEKLLAFWDAIKDDGVGDFKALFTERVSEFVELYLESFVKLAYMIYGAEKDGDFALILEKIIVPFAQCSNFETEFAKCCKKMSDKTESYIVNYFNYRFANDNEFAKKLESVLVAFLEGQSKSNRLYIFDKLKKNCENIPAVTKFIKEYEQNHMSLFRKLFSTNKKGSDTNE